jgi:hypothetical protein
MRYNNKHHNESHNSQHHGPVAGTQIKRYRDEYKILVISSVIESFHSFNAASAQ